MSAPAPAKDTSGRRVAARWRPMPEDPPRLRRLLSLLFDPRPERDQGEGGGGGDA
jgi:hypothetical protein